ncbi:hypothetical protein PC129_g21563 [Phytophthora cactorum]|uniref:Uncharacterized protein n=1 Tax=Phytophthora cactorum TaxID=29920 RepID=A0A8T1H5F0_9STRA|nr:hypothetical protein PC112_g22432 [Phytophthora cactorum]KAG2796459.1 hypothetical protein PC111_g21712 [Phytophthora cactorum]KAG2824018.1 hypothetical protein PC113_g22095 [Phytophthora cactorum]KAG2875699.1 hypothetical protein PC114_g24577 [Phytophthora cactorum]KAG2881489.1 hypothetical protein PC115_g22215 [Phytophthora cactorum]
MRAFLEGTEALAPNAQAAFLLSDKALARVRRDLMSGRLLKDSWAGPKTQEPWKSLINDFNVRALPERITKDLHKGRFVTLKSTRSPLPKSVALFTQISKSMKSTMKRGSRGCRHRG